jgi:hypothetical protein
LVIMHKWLLLYHWTIDHYNSAINDNMPIVSKIRADSILLSTHTN